MQFFFRNCTHIMTRTQGEKFEDMILVKIANKGTSLTEDPMQAEKSNKDGRNSD